MAHEHGTTVVSDRSSAGVVTAIVAVVLILLLIWAIFFSGWFMDRGDDTEPSQTNIQEREEGDTDVNIQEQPQDTETQAPNTGSTSGGTNY